MPSSFALNAWRASTRERREIFRALILKNVTDGGVERALDDLKRSISFNFLNAADQNIFNVAAHDARVIAECWNFLEISDKKRFSDGTLAPSGLARIARATVR